VLNAVYRSTGGYPAFGWCLRRAMWSGVVPDEAWLYVTLVLDLHARDLSGWAMSGTMGQKLMLRTPDVALIWRDPEADLVHSSHLSSQCMCGASRWRIAASGDMLLLRDLRAFTRPFRQGKVWPALAKSRGRLLPDRRCALCPAGSEATRSMDR
jgi:hypothetical protein